MKSNDIWPKVLQRLRQFIADTGNVELVCELTDVKPATLGDWLVNKQPALGMKLIALMHLLDHYGPRIQEVSALPAFNRMVGQLVAFKVITLEEAGEVLKVKNPQTILEIMRGTPPAKPQFTLQDLQELHGAELRRKLADLPVLKKNRQQSAVAEEPHVQVTTPIEPARPAAAQKQIPEQQTVPDLTTNPSLALAILVGAALPLARHLNEDGTLDERNRYRQFVGLDNLHPLLNELTALTSERARSQRK